MSTGDSHGNLRLCNGRPREAYESNEAKKLLSPHHRFELKFRKRNDVQTIRIHGKCIGDDGMIFPRFCYKERLVYTEDMSQFAGQLSVQMD